MAVFIEAVAGRDRSFEATYFDEEGNNSDVTAADATAMKIGRNDTLVFELSSDTDSGNGSSMTAENPTTVILDRRDLTAIGSGIFDVEFLLYDASDSNRVKSVSRGALVVHSSLPGDDERDEL